MKTIPFKAPDTIPGRLSSLLLLLLLAGGCEINSGNPAGFELTGRGPSSVVTDTLVVTGADTSWAVPLPMVASNRLLVGRTGGFVATALISFKDLPADAVVEDAVLQLRRAGVINEEESPPNLVISAQPVFSDWDSTWSSADLPALLLAPVVDQFSMTYGGTVDTLGFGLPAALVQSWVDDEEAARRGVALTTDASALWALVAHSDQTTSGTSRRPRLRIRWHPVGGGASRVTTSPVRYDLHLVEYAQAPPAGELWVARGAAWRTLLTFDFSGLPPEATINRAVLRLAIKPGEGVVPPYGIGVSAPASVDPWNLPPLDMVQEGQSSSAISVVDEDSTAAILVNRPLAALISGGSTDYGLLLFATSEFTSLGLLRLLDSTAPTGRVARIELIYSLPPGSTP